MAMAAIQLGCEAEDFGSKRLSRQDIYTFLSQYDPAMNIKRDEIVRSIIATREQLSRLESLKYSYSSERAKSYVEEQISKVEEQESRLVAILGSFDASIEVAMAAKEIDAANGGGLLMKESHEIILQAEQISRYSDELSSDVSSLFSEQLAGADTGCFKSEDSDKAEIAEIARASGNTTWMQDSVIDACNMGMRTAVIDDDDGWSNLRAQPSMSARIIRRIYQDEKFFVAPASGRWVTPHHSGRYPEMANRWHEVKTEAGETGWMHTTVIRFTHR